MNSLPTPQTHNLLPPAPLKIEGAFASQQIAQAAVDTMKQAIDLFYELQRYAPIPESYLTYCRQVNTVHAVLIAWGIPIDGAKWLACHLPRWILTRIAPVMNEVE